MRCIVTILAVTGLTAGCVLPLDNTSGGTDGGTSVCDERGACSVCSSCAVDGPCSAVFNQCMADANCTGIDQCFSLCGADAACKDQCYANNPAGADLYSQLTSCIYCGQCPSDCPGVQACQ